MDEEIDIDDILQATKFTRDQVERFLINFNKLAHNRQLNLDGFKKLIKQFGIKVSEKLEERVFNYIASSRGSKSTIDFRSFINYFDIIQKGNKVERMNLCFNLIDSKLKGDFGVVDLEKLMLDMYLEKSSTYELQYRITMITIEIFAEMTQDDSMPEDKEEKEEKEEKLKLEVTSEIDRSAFQPVTKEQLLEILEARRMTLNEFLKDRFQSQASCHDFEGLPPFLGKRIKKTMFYAILDANNNLYDFFLKLGASLGTLLNLAGQNQYGEISKVLQNLWFKFEAAFKATGLDEAIRKHE